MVVIYHSVSGTMGIAPTPQNNLPGIAAIITAGGTVLSSILTFIARRMEMRQKKAGGA